MKPDTGSLVHFDVFLFIFLTDSGVCLVKTGMGKFGGEGSLGVNITSLIIYKSFPWAQEGFILDG